MKRGYALAFFVLITALVAACLPVLCIEGGFVQATGKEFDSALPKDFYLEGKRLGDFRRHPANIIGVPVPGSTYWKAGFAPVGNNTCYPLPITETDNNPNFH